MKVSAIVEVDVMKIVVLDDSRINTGDLSWERMEKLGELAVYGQTPAGKILERIGDAQAVYTNQVSIDGGLMDQCPCLEYIGVLATGYNIVDVRAAAERGITVTNVPGYGTEAVSQFAIGLLLELCGRVGDYSRRVMEGEWLKRADQCHWGSPLIQLAGKTMGIVGMGRIGLRTARIARALGMEILYDSPHRNEEAERDGFRRVSREELFRQADVISLHCPLFDGTKEMINRETIAMMKRGVLIVNTSRGGLVDEQALREGLESGQVGGAASDVAVKEPMGPDSPLYQAPNMIVTPHIAWGTKEARQRMIDIATDNMAAYLSGHPQNMVSDLSDMADQPVGGTADRQEERNGLE